MGAALAAVTLNADDWKDHEVVAAVDALYGEKIGKDFLRRSRGGGAAREVGANPAGPALGARFSREDASRRGGGPRASRPRLRPPSQKTLSPLLCSRQPAARFDDPVAHAEGPRGDRPWVSVAVLGVAAWWVPYRLCGAIAKRVPAAARERDQIALYKLVAGVVLFPVFLLLECTSIWAAAGPLWADISQPPPVPFAGVSSLLFFEYASWRERQARELLALLLAPGAIARLRAERDALVAECDRLAGTLATAADNPAR